MKVVELVPTRRNDHRWTDAELKQLLAMWFDGKTVEEIAAAFNISPRGVNKCVQRLRANGITVPRRKAGNTAGRASKYWTPEEVEYLIRRRNEKASTETIANELDRTFMGVQGMVQALRKSGVPVTRFGQGRRKLWDPARLAEAVALRSISDNS